MSGLLIQDLSVVDGSVKRLEQISCSISPGDVLAVIGANGSGKSTLVNALTESHMGVSGRVLFEGQNLHDLPQRCRATQVAVLPQKNPLNFPFTVDDVVLLGRTPHNTGTIVDRQCVDQVMAGTDITHLKNRIYTELSGGEQQRTQLARVLSQIWPTAEGPRLLVLDEPCNGLDIAHKQQLVQLVSRLAKTGVAIIWVEHDLNLVSLFADKILALHKGKMAGFGQSQNVLTEQLVHQLYGAEVRFITDRQSGKRVMVF